MSGSTQPRADLVGPPQSRRAPKWRSPRHGPPASSQRSGSRSTEIFRTRMEHIRAWRRAIAESKALASKPRRLRRRTRIAGIVRSRRVAGCSRVQRRGTERRGRTFPSECHSRRSAHSARSWCRDRFGDRRSAGADHARQRSPPASRHICVMRYLTVRRHPHRSAPRSRRLGAATDRMICARPRLASRARTGQSVATRGA